MEYRKKPIVINAFKWEGELQVDYPSFVKDSFELGQIEVGNNELIIHTLEGDMIAKEGDYIIQGIKGEFYPCKPDIFEQTYEKVKPE